METKLRITSEYLKSEMTEMDITNFFKTLTDHPDTMILVEEQQPSQHIHGYIKCNVTLPTLRSRIKTLLIEEGNKAFSISNTHTDWKGYCGYMLKHQDTKILYLGKEYNEDELREYYEQVSVPKHQVKSRDEIVEMKKSLKVKYDTPKAMLKDILKYYKEKQKLMNKAHIAQQLNTLWYWQEEHEQFELSILEEAGLTDEATCEIDHVRMENKQLKAHLKHYLRSLDPE